MIQINEQYFIDADEHQYILKKKVTSKKETGEETETYQSKSYHTSLSGAITEAGKLLNRNEIHNLDLTLKEAIKTFKTIENSIRNLVEG